MTVRRLDGRLHRTPEKEGTREGGGGGGGDAPHPNQRGRHL